MKVKINTLDGLIETDSIGDLIELYGHKCFYNRGYDNPEIIVLTEYRSGFAMGSGKNRKDAMKDFLSQIKEIKVDEIETKIKTAVDNAIFVYGVANEL